MPYILYPSLLVCIILMFLLYNDHDQYVLVNHRWWYYRVRKVSLRLLVFFSIACGVVVTLLIQYHMKIFLLPVSL